MPISWGEPAPKKLAKGSIHLLAVRAGETRHVCALGPMVGLQTHWVGSRTLPCFGAECKHCDYPLTWKGFIPVVVDGFSWNGPSKGRFPWVLVVTEEVGEECQTWVRGTVATVQRPGRKSNGPMLCSLRGDVKPPTDLMPSFDVKPYVLRACGYGLASYTRLFEHTRIKGVS